MPPPKLEGHVSAHRDPAEHHGLVDAQGVEQGGQVVGVLRDGDAGQHWRDASATQLLIGDVGWHWHFASAPVQHWRDASATQPPRPLRPKPRRSGAIATPAADRLDLRVPDRVIQREGVQQHDGRPPAAVRVKQFRRRLALPIS